MNARSGMNRPIAGRIKSAASLLAGALLLAAPAALTAGAPLADIPRCDIPPVIDADFSEPCWRQAREILQFVSLTHSNRPATNAAVRLLRDDVWLYVAADITHPEPSRIFPKALEHDGYIQGENCIKIALDPGRGRPGGWYLFRVSAHNVKSDVYVLKTRGIKPAWSIPWRSSAKTNPQGWRAEIAIPVPPLAQWSQFSETMGLNIVAHVIYPVLDPMAVEIGEYREVLSWQPAPPVWWYASDCFAAAAPFARTGSLPFLPKYEELQVHGYEVTASGLAYGATVSVRNLGAQTGAVKVAAADLPGAGAAREYTNTLCLAAGATGSVTFAMPVQNTGARRLRVELIPENEPDASWLQTVVEKMPVLDVFSAYADRSYYTGEKAAGIVCRIGLPPASWSNFSITCTAGVSALNFTAPVTGALTRVEANLSDLPCGNYPLTLNLQAGAAASPSLARAELELVKRAPNPGHEWKIDREQCRLLHDGRPVFVYGVLYGHRIEECAANFETNLQELAAAGINTWVYWNTAASNGQLVAAMDLAAKYGLHFGLRLEMFGDGAVFQPQTAWLNWPYRGLTFLKMDMAAHPQMVNLSRSEKSRRFAEVFDQAAPFIRAGIMSVRSHPALAFYDSFDEPSVERYFDHYIQGRKLYGMVNDLDGYHPVRVLWNADLPPPDEKYTDWRDIISRDPYWVPPVGGGRTSPLFAGMQTDEMFQRALVERKPVWPTPVLEHCGSRHFKRLTAPDEQRSQTYLSLIYGASGFLYFIYPVIHQATWDGLAALGREIREMTPWLVTLPVPMQLEYRAGGRSVPASDPGARDLHVSVKYVAGRGYLVLAANSALYPVDMEMTLPWPGLAGEAQQLFSGKTHALRDGCLTERLEPLATRAYLFQADAMPPPLAVSVEAIPHPGLARVENETPAAGRSGHRNVMPNPGFEEATLPHYPDYWFPQASGMAWHPEQRVGRSNPNLFLDENNPYEGKVSFRLQAPAGQRGRSVYCRLGPQHDRPTPYVLSIYLKGSRDGLPARLTTPGGARDVAVTTQWERYYVPFTMPAHASRYTTFALALLEGGTLWADAIQLEQGTAPTPFDP